MWFFFYTDLFLRRIYHFRYHSVPSLSLPPGDFPGESDVVPSLDVIHRKYSIKIPKQCVIVLRIERRTRW